ncbi:MAG: hypothetical protein WAM81_05205 [Acidimicrobiia bacterium]
MSTKAHKAMTDAAVIAVAIAVAVTGFIALFKGLPSASSTASTDQVAAAVQPDAQPAAATTITSQPAITLAEQSISPTVIRTLAAQGSAWFLPTDQAVQMLPTSIVNVLESRGVVLQVQLGAG